MLPLRRTNARQLTLFPVTPPAQNRAGDNSHRNRSCQIVPEKHAKLCKRHVAALVAIATVRGYPLFASQRMAPVMLLVYTKQRAGVFSFQQLMPPGIKPPQHCASPGVPAWRRYYCNPPRNSPSPPHFQNSARPARSLAERSDAGNRCRDKHRAVPGGGVNALPGLQIQKSRRVLSLRLCL